MPSRLYSERHVHGKIEHFPERDMLSMSKLQALVGIHGVALGEDRCWRSFRV